MGTIYLNSKPPAPTKPGGTIFLKEPERFTKRRKRKKLSGKIIKAELVVAGVLGAGLVGLAAPGVVLAGGRSLLGLGKKVVGGAGKFALKHPGKTLFLGGLAVTPGGRKLIREIPKKIFKGGEVLGKVVGGEDTGLGIKEALITAGLVGAGAIAGKKIFDVVKGKGKEKVEKVIPSLPGTRDIGTIPQAPVGIGGIPIRQGAPGTVTGAPRQQISRPPVQNIIQIAVR